MDTIELFHLHLCKKWPRNAKAGMSVFWRLIPTLSMLSSKLVQTLHQSIGKAMKVRHFRVESTTSQPITDYILYIVLVSDRCLMISMTCVTSLWGFGFLTSQHRDSGFKPPPRGPSGRFFGRHSDPKRTITGGTWLWYSNGRHIPNIRYLGIPCETLTTSFLYMIMFHPFHVLHVLFYHLVHLTPPASSLFVVPPRCRWL